MKPIEAKYKGEKVLIVQILQDRMDCSIIAVYLDHTGLLSHAPIYLFTECTIKCHKKEES